MQATNNLEVMKLEGYLVSQDKTINFPVLGELSVAVKAQPIWKSILKIVWKQEVTCLTLP